MIEHTLAAAAIASINDSWPTCSSAPLRPPRIAHAPQLVLDRAPTLKELHLTRRELARERRLPRDGRLVCSIPVGDAEYEVRGANTYYDFVPVEFYKAEDPNEIGMLVGWHIVVRVPR